MISHPRVWKRRCQVWRCRRVHVKFPPSLSNKLFYADVHKSQVSCVQLACAVSPPSKRKTFPSSLHGSSFFQHRPSVSSPVTWTLEGEPTGRYNTTTERGSFIPQVAVDDHQPWSFLCQAQHCLFLSLISQKLVVLRSVFRSRYVCRLPRTTYSTT